MFERSRLYVGYHWISDTTGFIALSMVIVGTLIAIDTKRRVRIAGEPVKGEFSTIQTDGTRPTSAPTVDRPLPFRHSHP